MNDNKTNIDNIDDLTSLFSGIKINDADIIQLYIKYFMLSARVQYLENKLFTLLAFQSVEEIHNARVEYENEVYKSTRTLLADFLILKGVWKTD